MKLAQQVTEALKEKQISDDAAVKDLEKQIEGITSQIDSATNNADKESLAKELRALNAKLEAEMKKRSNGHKD